MGTEETKKYDERFRIIVAMGVFILFVFVWSASVSIVGIKAAGKSGGGKAGNVADTADKSGDSGETAVTPDGLSKLLLDGVDFSAKLSKATDDMAGNLVFVSDKSELHVYMASGSYADEIIIVKAADEATAKSDMAAVEQHLKDKKAEFDKYNADEVKKIDNVCLISKDCYVVACVSNNKEQAEKIITEALK